MNIAVWGLGNHAINNILPALNKTKALNLLGICTRNQENLKKYSTKYKCIPWSSHQDMLNKKNLDVIYLATPPELHFKQGVEILSSNKHFWSEKPLTNKYKNAQQLISLSKKNNLSVFEGFMYFYHPQFIELKKIIDNEFLGNLKEIRCTFELPHLENPGYRNNIKLGASALFDLGCYPISLILKLFENYNIELLKVDLKKNLKVDISGEISLKVNSSINCFLKWGYDKKYKNEIELIGSKQKVFTDKIFSKDKKYLPKFLYIDQNNKSTHKEIDQADHFELMFDAFYSFINPKKIKEESDFILKLSRFEEMVLNYKDQGV